jgi:hypothetical protein
LQGAAGIQNSLPGRQAADSLAAIGINPTVSQADGLLGMTQAVARPASSSGPRPHVTSTGDLVQPGGASEGSGNAGPAMPDRMTDVEDEALSRYLRSAEPAQFGAIGLLTTLPSQASAVDVLTTHHEDGPQREPDREEAAEQIHENDEVPGHKKAVPLLVSHIPAQSLEELQAVVVPKQHALVLCLSTLHCHLLQNCSAE